MRVSASAFYLLMSTTALLPAAALAEEVASMGGLEQITVTAQRRAQSMQDVPIAVSAITSQALENMGVTGTAEISVAVPGLFLSKTSTAVQPFLRGVGTASLAPGNDPSVPLYIDGVYHSAPTSLFFSFNNIERVEVLKGPQGTLFGRNATGGLVQVVTRDPTDETVAKVSLGYGRFEAFEGNAYISGGTEKIAADLAVVYKKQSDGWGKNLYQPSDSGVIRVNGQIVTPEPVDPRVGYGEEIGIRSKVVMRAGENTTAKLSFMYTEADGDMNHYRDLLPGAIGLNGHTDAGGFYDVNTDAPWWNKNHQYLVYGEVEHEMDFATIKSITSYLKAGSNIAVSSDASPYINTGHSVTDPSVKTFTQELQLLSNDNSGPDWLEWIVGFYYLDSRAGYDPLRSITGNNLEQNFWRYSYQDVNSIAAYGQATADLTDTTRLTVGLRYTKDKVKATQYNVGMNPNTIAFNTLAGAVPAQFQEGVVWNLVPWVSDSFEKVTGKVVLDQRLNEDILAYISFSRGYKAGVWNHGNLCTGVTIGQCFNVAPPVRPETLDAYEVGIKSDLLDNRLRLNLAAFYYDYKDLQVQAVVGVPPVGLLVNAATARVYGLELDGVAQVTDNFSVNFGASFLDAKYKSAPGAIGYLPNPVGPSYGNTSITYDAAGNDLTQSPDVVFNIGGNLTIPTSVGDFDVNATLYYNDGFFWDQQNRLRESSYTILNAQIAYQATENWRVRVWGKNLLDKKYYGYQFASSVGDQGAPAAPLTFGIAVDWEL